MVSTRRSRSSAGGESEQVTAGHASQEDVSSRPSKQAAAATAAVAALEPISEEPQQQPAPTPARRRRVTAEQQQQQQQLEQVQPEADQEEQQQAEQQQQQQLHGRGQQQHQQQTGQHPAEAVDLISDSDDDDDLDLGFDGPGVLQNLAAAIRSGFQSQSQQQQQQRQQQQQQQPSRLHAAAAAAAAAGRSSGRELDDSELQQLRWRPHTGLHIPAKAAAAVALTQPKQRKKPGQLQEEPVGALVDGSAAAAAAAAGSAETADPTAAAAGATKQPGLSKALRAPTLDAAARTKEAKKSAPDTAGSKWFDLPAPKITDEMKRDLRVLRLRGAYDPKRFYKSFDNAKFPKYFAMGTVVDDPLDSNNRLAKGQRRATLTEQLLVDAELTTSRKRRFNKLQDDAQKWAKHKKRKTSAPRKTPSKHRPKH